MSIDKVQVTDRTTLLQIIARNLLVAVGVLDSNSLPMVQVTDRTTLLQIIAAASIDLAAGGGGGGGSVAWGSITGLISAQADLVAALEAKANLAGGNTFTGIQVAPVVAQPALELAAIAPSSTATIAATDPDNIYVLDTSTDGVMLPPLVFCVEGKKFSIHAKNAGTGLGISSAGGDTISVTSFGDSVGPTISSGLTATLIKATTSLGVTWLYSVSGTP